MDICVDLIKNKIDSVDDLLKFNMEGYIYNDELSNGEVIPIIYKEKYIIKECLSYINHI